METGLEFEKPIADLKAEIDSLKSLDDPKNEEKIIQLRHKVDQVTRDIYSNLTPWQTVKVARANGRPQTADYISLIFDEYVSLHGDKLFGDDPAMMAGFAKLDQYKVMVMGHQKGRTTKERTACSFGCAHPEGYRKAIAKMKLAAKFNIPVICFIDTPGAYPGLGAEERGQAQAIAENMFEMSRLGTPIICVVIGEGGSGGALGIGVGDQVAMLEFSYYSVISPEGCAGILWKSHEHAEKAAEALRFTANHLLDFGIIDEIIKEPLGGAHRDHHQISNRLKMFLLKSIRGLREKPLDELLQQRYEKFRRMGSIIEPSAV